MTSFKGRMRHVNVTMSVDVEDAPNLPGSFVRFDIKPDVAAVSYYLDRGRWCVDNATVRGHRVKADGTTGATRHEVIFYGESREMPEWLQEIVNTYRPTAREV